MLRPLLFFKHLFLILGVLEVIHEYPALRLLPLLFLPQLFLYLIRIKEITFLILLFLAHEPNSNFLPEEPLVGPLQVVLLILFVFRIYYFPQHHF